MPFHTRPGQKPYHAQQPPKTWYRLNEIPPLKPGPHRHPWDWLALPKVQMLDGDILPTDFVHAVLAARDECDRLIDLEERSLRADD